jgi:hypothetical protein
LHALRQDGILRQDIEARLAELCLSGACWGAAAKAAMLSLTLRPVQPPPPRRQSLPAHDAFDVRAEGEIAAAVDAGVGAPCHDDRTAQAPLPDRRYGTNYPARPGVTIPHSIHSPRSHRCWLGRLPRCCALSSEASRAVVRRFGTAPTASRGNPDRRVSYRRAPSQLPYC